MKKIIIVLLASLVLGGCGKNNNTNKISSKSNPVTQDLTSDQLDSIGKSFIPKIGKYGGSINISIGSDPDGFCPATAGTKYTSDVIQYVFNGLVTSDPVTLESKPSLSERWEVSEDGKLWTFFLRKDVKFSDGVLLTAYDVDFTFNEVIFNENIRSQYRDMLTLKGERIKVNAIDSFTVRFELPFSYAPFLQIAGIEIMPKHIYEKVAKNGTLESFLSSGAKASDIVGTGPFMVEKVELGVRIVLKKNPYFWKKDAEGNRLPYLDKINILIIKEPNQNMLRFQDGEIDQFALSGEHYPILKPLEAKNGFTLYEVGPSWGKSFMCFNQNTQKNPKTNKYYLDTLKQKWFRNTNFRKAVAYSINYLELINIIYNGRAYPSTGIWGDHKGFFHNPDVTTYSYDLQKGKELLAEDGFVDKDGDGFLEDKDGNIVEFTLTTSAGMKSIEDMYEIVRKDLRELGLKVHLNLIEFNILVSKLNNTYDWDAIALGLTGGFEPHFSKAVEVHSSFRYYVNPRLPKASTPWEKRIADIFELGAVEMDKNKRKVLYDEWQKIAMEQCTRIYMPVSKSCYGVNNRVKNIHLTRYLAYFMQILHNIEEIYVEES